MEYSINIAQLYEQAFGERRPIYLPLIRPILPTVSRYQPQEQNLASTIEYEGVERIIFDEDNEAKSSLGTVVVSPVEFQAGSYQQRLVNGELRRVDYPKLLLPPTTVLQVDRSKKIIKTPLHGGRGEFKEMIGTNDATVRIRGIWINETNDDREAMIRSLSQLEQVPKELEVACDYLSWLGIQHLVIESMNLPILQGQPTMQPFELNCTSDNPIELISSGL